MNLNLQGKTALVCGSTGGIGKASALELAALGASVVLVARNEEKLRHTLSQLATAAGQQHTCIAADFAFPEKLREQVEAFTAKNPVHILVNNTGGPPSGPILQARSEEFVQAFSNHLLCNHLLVQAVAEGMKAEKYGRIINIISTSVKQPLPNLGVSNTIRAAVANWSKTLAGELAPFGITVNNVLPGATHTARLETLAEAKAQKTGKKADEILAEMAAEVPMKRVGLPEEIAAAVAFLASPAASYISGINVPVDGGRTACL